jgi:hypothetical protein
MFRTGYDPMTGTTLYRTIRIGLECMECLTPCTVIASLKSRRHAAENKTARRSDLDTTYTMTH